MKGLERADRDGLEPAGCAGDLCHPIAEGIDELRTGRQRLVADAIRAVRTAAATRLIVVRAASAFYGYPLVAAVRRASG